MNEKSIEELELEIKSLREDMKRMQSKGHSWDAFTIALLIDMLDIDNETQGFSDDMYKTAHNLAHKLRDRVAELEAENNELTERVSMLDVTGVFQKLGEMRTIELVADLKAERDEAKAMVERLIEAIELGNGVVLMHEPEISSVQKWYAKMATVIAEWREREE